MVLSRWLVIPMPLHLVDARVALLQGLAGAVEHRLPDVEGIVLHPPGLRVELLDLLARHRVHFAAVVEEDDPGARGPLVDRHDVSSPSHATPSGSRCLDVGAAQPCTNLSYAARSISCPSSAGALRLQADQPALSQGIGVDGVGLVPDDDVDLGDGAAQRDEQVVGGLDRLDAAHDVAAREGAPHLGEVEEDHVPELLLGMLGDADARDVTLEGDPDVVLRVLQLFARTCSPQ